MARKSSAVLVRPSRSDQATSDLSGSRFLRNACGIAALPPEASAKPDDERQAVLDVEPDEACGLVRHAGGGAGALERVVVGQARASGADLLDRLRDRS